MDREIHRSADLDRLAERKHPSDILEEADVEMYDPDGQTSPFDAQQHGFTTGCNLIAALVKGRGKDPAAHIIMIYARQDGKEDVGFFVGTYESIKKRLETLPDR